MSIEITVQGGTSKKLLTGGKYCPEDIVVTAEGGNGEPEQEKTVEITENGTVEVLPDDGYALSKVTVNVDVTSSGDGDGLLPAGYTLVPSIKFTGEQAVDTGVICNQNTQIRVIFTAEENKGMYIYGSASEDNTASLTAYRSASGGRWRFGNQNIVLTTQVDEDIVWGVMVNKERILRCNVSSTFGTVNDFTTPGTLVLGGGRLATGIIEESTRLVGKIVAFELFNGEEPIRSFVPCKNDNGVCGFWDNISKGFFTTVGETPLEWSFL